MLRGNYAEFLTRTNTFGAEYLLGALQHPQSSSGLTTYAWGIKVTSGRCSVIGELEQGINYEFKKFRSTSWRNEQYIQICLLNQTEDRGPWRGKILVRLFELKNDVDPISCLLYPRFSQARYMPDRVWLHTLTHLADIFSRINNLKLHSRARKQKFSTWNTKLNNSHKNFRFWEEKLKSNQAEYFNPLHDFPIQN
jgi:hypothetical protein